MNKVYYNQADSRWASHPYTAPSYPNATIKTSGCGVTCGAMIISSCKETIYPDAMGDLAKANGYRVDGGTADGFFSFICEKWGLEIERIHSSYDALEKCKNGYFVVMCASKGLWTTGGHFILAVGARNDEIQIFDPYLYNGKFNVYGRASANVSVEGTSCYVQIDKFKQYSNIQRLWAIKVSDTNNIEEPVTPNTAEIKYVSTNGAGLNVRSGRGTQYSITTTLAKGTQVMVYDIVDGWARIGSNMYVSAQYLSDTKPSTSQPAQSYNRGTVGQTKTFANRTIIYENSNLSGTQYNYLARTAVVVLENVSANVDKIRVVKTGREGYINISAYGGSTSSAPAITNTVGQTKIFRGATVLYSNSNLSGTQYQYKAETRVKILQNVSSSVDRVYVVKTGRKAYCRNNVYK